MMAGTQIVRKIEELKAEPYRLKEVIPGLPMWIWLLCEWVYGEGRTSGEMSATRFPRGEGS